MSAESDQGRVIAAWPEDYVLEGDKLEELQKRLALRATTIGERFIDSPERQAHYEGAVKDVLRSIGRPALKGDVRDIVTDCWERSGGVAGEGGVRTQGEYLEAAMLDLVYIGDVVESEGMISMAEVPVADS